MLHCSFSMSYCNLLLTFLFFIPICFLILFFSPLPSPDTSILVVHCRFLPLSSWLPVFPTHKCRLVLNIPLIPFLSVFPIFLSHMSHPTFLHCSRFRPPRVTSLSFYPTWVTPPSFTAPASIPLESRPYLSIPYESPHLPSLLLLPSSSVLSGKYRGGISREIPPCPIPSKWEIPGNTGKYK